ncbi:MAG TPA: glycosyltransferase [Candidatus Gallacutalibacter stercoravium]|nr:glycosyltransferase [Candidatus Gallacutalibacter stercoravium]
MNILVLSRFAYDRSPYRCFVHDQVRAYRALGHDARVISCLSLGKGGVNDFAAGKRENVVDGVPVYYPRHPSFSSYGQYGANVFFGYHAVRRTARTMAPDFVPDVIHAHFIDFDGAVAVRLAQDWGIPAVITTHGYDTVDEIAAGHSEKLIPICRRADAVVAVSSMLKNALLRQDPSLRIEVILNGFRLEAVPAEKTKKRHSVISVGALTARKHFDITIQALALARRKIPDATLTVVGQGEERQRLEELAQKLGLGQAVTFTGFLPNEEVLARMAEHEVFAMPSVREGFGIVYPEAMASGCVTIGTQGEGIADFITDGVNGGLVPPGDPEALAGYLVRCFTDEAFRRRLASAGAESARGLTWENNAKRNLALFERLAAEKKKSGFRTN